MRYLICFAALAILAPLACSDPAGPEPRPDPAGTALVTDRTEYKLAGISAGYETTLVVTYTNLGSRPVYWPGCNSTPPVGPIYGFARAEPDTGRVLSSLAWACVGGVPALKIPPGVSRTDTVRFVSLESPHAQPPDEPSQRVGRMRIVYDITGSVNAEGEANWRDRLPLAERQSNVFRITY